jgi:tRNA dimethylallyltransferase
LDNPTIIITGPTATGKTTLAVQLAQEYKGEIISADSRQVFRRMDIGTGKDLHEYGEIPYHLIDILEPDAEFSVSDFQTKALRCIKTIGQRQKLPIICGGTGHYIKALIENYQFPIPKTDLEVTNQLEKKDRAFLYQKIKDLGIWDHHHWENDSKRRMVRAIEKARLVPKENQISQDESSNYTVFYTHLDRQIIRDRIKIRLDQRLAEGMVDEVQALIASGVSESRLERFGLEYKWILFYLTDKLSHEEMQGKLYTEICRYAKRQMTFIRYLEKSGHHLIPVQNYKDLKAAIQNQNILGKI